MAPRILLSFRFGCFGLKWQTCASTFCALLDIEDLGCCPEHHVYLQPSQQLAGHRPLGLHQQQQKYRSSGSQCLSGSHCTMLSHFILLQRRWGCCLHPLYRYPGLDRSSNSLRTTLYKTASTTTSPKFKLNERGLLNTYRGQILFLECNWGWHILPFRIMSKQQSFVPCGYWALGMWLVLTEMYCEYQETSVSKTLWIERQCKSENANHFINILYWLYVEMIIFYIYRVKQNVY